MLRDIWTYLQTLFQEATAAMTSSILAAMLLVWQVRGGSIVGWIGWSFVGLCFFQASFTVWRKEYNLRKALSDKSAIANKLAFFLKEGSDIMSKLQNSQTNAPIEIANNWAKKCEEELESTLGKSYTVRFTNIHGLLPLSPPSLAPNVQENIWWAMSVRLQRLNEFIKELGQ